MGDRMTFRRSDSIENGFSGKWCSRASAYALLACLPLLAACGSAGGEGEADGSIRGELHTYRIDYLDGRSERTFYLASPDARQAEIKLNFASDPGLQPWTQLKVWGTPTTDGLTVERYQEQTETTTDGVEVSTQALSTVTKKTATVGFVLMDVGDGVNLTAADANTAIFGTRAATQAGLNQFYNENSYGGFNFTGDILGPETVTTLGTCQHDAPNAIEKAWPTTLGKTYDHWMQYIGSNYASCAWGGLGGEGTAARPASGSWYNASTSCTVLNQEVGHNLGLMHSNSITCTNAPFADDPTTCMGAEYGDRHTVMGSGCAHFNSYEKWYEGFIGGCNGVRATATGTYVLLPTELPCDGVQALQIPMPKTRPFHNTTGTATVVNLSKYYLELRTKVSIDGKEPAPDVLVLVGGDVPASNKTSEFTWVLDMDPTTPKTAEGLVAGGSYTDPAGGVTFAVQDIDATHATISVTVAASSGPPTCMDGTAFSGPGPSACGTTVPVGSGAGGSAGAGTTGGASAGGAASSGGASNTGASNGGASNGGANSAGSSSLGGSAGSSSGGGASGAGIGIAGGFNSAGASGSVGSSSAGAASAAAGTGGASSGNAGSSNNAPASSSDSSGCSCRAAPTAPSRSGLASIALLVLGLALRRRRERARVARTGVFALGASLAAALAGCSSKSEPTAGDQAATSGVSTDGGDCTAAQGSVSAGLSQISKGGYNFTLTALAPSAPVQSVEPPGNTWTISLTDSSGAPVTGATIVETSVMPEHMHSTTPGAVIEQGGGTYELEDLLLPMPGLYSITLDFSPASGVTESVVFPLCMITSS